MLKKRDDLGLNDFEPLSQTFEKVESKCRETWFHRSVYRAE